MRCLYSGHMLTFLAPYRCQLSSCSSCRELALHAGRVQHACKQRSTREYALTACALASRARRRLWPRSSLTAAITAAALTTAAAAAAASVVPPPPQKPTPPPSARHRPPASSLAAHASTVWPRYRFRAEGRDISLIYFAQISDAATEYLRKISSPVGKAAIRG